MLEHPLAKLIITLVCSFVFVVVVAYAAFAGYRTAQSKAVIANGMVMRQALVYFFQDQGRYPTGVEFTDQNIMRSYITGLPTPAYAGGVCNQSYSYRNPSQKTYELSLCLSRATGAYARGVNMLKP